MHNRFSTYKLFIGVAIFLCLLLLFFFAVGVLHLRYSRGYDAFRELRQFQKTPLGVVDVDLIRDWMSFDYLSRSFNLPPDYLKTKLAITNPRYPNISMRMAADEKHISRSTFLESVKKAVREYLTANAN